MVQFIEAKNDEEEDDQEEDLDVYQPRFAKQVCDIYKLLVSW